MTGLPKPLQVNNGGTNLYGDVPDGGANRQNLLNKMLTGGKKDKKGGAPIQGSVFVPHHNASPHLNSTQHNLLQIAGQAQANSALDDKVHKGGRRKKTQRKKTKKLIRKKRKSRNTRKKSRK